MEDKKKNKEFNSLPEWLQKLWEISPDIARKCEKERNEMLDILIKNYMTMPFLNYQTRYNQEMKELIEKVAGMTIEKITIEKIIN